jgi:hypothetical protein
MGFICFTYISKGINRVDDFLTGGVFTMEEQTKSIVQQSLNALLENETFLANRLSHSMPFFQHQIQYISHFYVFH